MDIWSSQSIAGFIKMSKARAPKKLTSFLNKTYEIVNDPTNSVTVAWTTDGMGFTINSVPDFVEQILPRYFKHSNFASFVRQLNMYDFHKSREQGCENVFRHPSFLRGRRSLLRDIRRKSTEITSESVLSKSDCQHLLSKVQELQGQHQTLEATVQELRTQNHDMKEHNMSLLHELAEFKAREEQLEGLLNTFSGQLQNVTSPDHYFKGHRHNHAAPLCLVEEGQSMELEGTERTPSEELDKQGRYAGARMRLPEASAGSPESADTEMEAEMDRLLMPED